MVIYLWILSKLSKKTPGARRFFGMMRVLAYVTVLSLVMGAFTIHNAMAGAKDQSLRLGRDLQGLSDLLAGGNEIMVNNQPIFISATETTDSVSTVLDRFEAHCNHDPALSEMRWSDLGNLKGTVAKPKDINGVGVLRSEDKQKGDGAVVCFTNTGGSQKDLLNAVEAFGRTRDLSSFGQLRYVHVSTDKDGGTVVRAVWTEGSFNIGKLMPTADGSDSPGSDSPDVPRPGHSVRRFTAEAVGTPYRARIYETSESPEKLLGWYDTVMAQRGWLVVDSPLRDQKKDPASWFTRGGKMTMVSLMRDGDKTRVVVGDLGAPSDPPKAKVLP